jgi:hypothetical protein
MKTNKHKTSNKFVNSSTSLQADCCLFDCYFALHLPRPFICDEDRRLLRFIVVFGGGIAHRWLAEDRAGGEIIGREKEMAIRPRSEANLTFLSRTPLAVVVELGVRRLFGRGRKGGGQVRR